MTDFDDEEVPLETLFEAFLDARQEETHTALPGKVIRYTPGEQVADVQPLIRRALRNPDETVERTPMPIIRAVPIGWPRAGDWFVHMPLAAGDTVLLLCCERDISRWRATGELSDPNDTRLHNLSHAVAIPGVYSRQQELSDTPDDAMVLGKDGGSTIRIQDNGQILLGGTDANDVVAMAAKVNAIVNAIAGTVTAPGDGGAAIKAAVVAALSTIGGTVGALKVRAV